MVSGGFAMRYSRLATSALAAACLMFFAGGGPARACQLFQIGQLPVTMEGDQPLVDVSIDGHPVRFLLDTGASKTLLTQNGAERLGLKTVQLNGLTFYGVGGSSVARTTRIKELRLGSAVLHDFDMIVTGTMRTDRAVGLLGRDVLLSHGDLELDLAHHLVRLLQPKDCHGDDVVYWSISYMMASINTQSGAVMVDASLNGKLVYADLDTGAGHSVVTLDAAQRAGVTPQSRGVADAGASSGMGGVVQTWIGTFQTLGVGGEVVQHAELELADMFSNGRQVSTGSILRQDVVETPDMLLGADFVRAHHIYIAPKQNKVYFTYNGGPIFELPADATVDAIASHPSTIEGHLDRGRALVNEQRYAEALAEFDAAIALDARSQEAWSERAIAHAWLVDPAAATDADKADQLGAPTIVAARARGLYAANAGDPSGARAAFRRGLALAPNDVSTLYHLLVLDVQAGDAEAAARDVELLKRAQLRGDLLCHAEVSARWRPEMALADCERELQRTPSSVRLQLDRIVLLHRLAREPEADKALDALQAQRLSAVDLNNICYDLAAENIHLDRALAGCDASLKRTPGAAATLDSRGFVLMRLGRNAEALEAYNAALAAQPKQSASLYGRGLVEARMGRADDAARDIHTALAARPDLRRTFEEMGIKS